LRVFLELLKDLPFRALLANDILRVLVDIGLVSAVLHQIGYSLLLVLLIPFQLVGAFLVHVNTSLLRTHVSPSIHLSCIHTPVVLGEESWLEILADFIFIFLDDPLLPFLLLGHKSHLVLQKLVKRPLAEAPMHLVSLHTASLSAEASSSGRRLLRVWLEGAFSKFILDPAFIDKIFLEKVLFLLLVESLMDLYKIILRPLFSPHLILLEHSNCSLSDEDVGFGVLVRIFKAFVDNFLGEHLVGFVEILDLAAVKLHLFQQVCPGLRVGGALHAH